MAIRSGLAGQLGVAAETAYGTYTAPDHFFEVTKAELKDTSTWTQGGGLAASRLQRLGSRRVKTAYGASGSLEMEIANKGFGVLLQALMGTTVTPAQQNTSTGYLQTHTLASPYGKSLTLQVGLPDLGGTVRPFTLLGGKVLSAEFDCAAGQMLTSKWDINGRELVDSQALVAASYPTTTAPFSFVQSTVKIGPDVASALAVDGIKKTNVKIERSSNVDRNYFGQGGKIEEPVMNDYQPITGTLEADFIDKTVFVDRFHQGTAFALVWEFVAGTLGGTPSISETFRITLPQNHFTGDTPTLDGPDIISGSFPFEASFDGANQPKIEYISTDVTL